MRLSETHMIFHAAFLLINVAINLTMTCNYIFVSMRLRASQEIAAAYYICQPLSLLLMLYVIFRMSKKEGAPHVRLMIDEDGCYRFVQVEPTDS